jgi:hypothetical protein
VEDHIRIYHQLNHPNILKVISWFKNDVELSILFEEASGGNFYEKIRSQNKRDFTDEQILTYFQ